MKRLAERHTAEIVLLDEGLRFMRVVWNLQHALQSASKRMERSLGITGPQRLALLVVGTVPGITGAELARVLHLDPSTITGILQRLSAKRLLVKESDSTDARLVRLRLTAAGERLQRPARSGTIESAIRTALKAFPASKVRATIEVLERVSALMVSDAGLPRLAKN